MSIEAESAPAKTSLLVRFFSFIDTKAAAIMLVGVLQIPACLLLLYASVALFPPDARVFWNLPVPKGGSPGVGPYSITIAFTIALIWHTIAMIKKRPWAIMVAALPYLAIGALRFGKGLSQLIKTESPVDIKVLADVAVDICISLMSIYMFAVALKIIYVRYFDRPAQQ